MPFDGSGNFNRVMNWVNDAVAGIKIKADRHDSEDDNFASGLSNTLTKDGQSQPTANIPLNGKKIINLAAPTNPTDAATKAYADAIRTFSTAITLSGAVPEARIGFTVADIGFGARTAGTPAGYFNRFVWNDKPDLSGNDVVLMDEAGAISLTYDNLLYNVVRNSPTTFLSMAAGFGGWLQFNKANGAWQLYGTAASVAAGAAATAVVKMTLDKDGHLTAIGNVAANGNFLSTTAALVLGTTGAGNVYLRPNGIVSGTGQAALDASGNLTVAGNVISNPQGNFIGNNGGGVVVSPGVVGTCYFRPNGPASASGEFTINSTGAATVNGTLSVASSITTTGGVMQTGAANLLLAAGGTGGGVYLRPKGAADATAQGQLDSNGNFVITGTIGQKATAGQWTAPSDIRLKDVVGDYQHGLAEVLQIQPVRYTYKANPDLGEIIGLIAQDIEAVFPECVTQGPGEIDGETVADLRMFDPTALQYALINAVKELSAKLDAATARIATLEAA